MRKDRLVENFTSERVVRFVVLPPLTFMMAYGGSNFSEIAVDKFQRGQLLDSAVFAGLGLACIGATGIFTAASIRGRQFVNEFNAMLEAPSRFR